MQIQRGDVLAIAGFGGVLCLLMAAGCDFGQTVGALPPEGRALLLAEEPAGAQGVLDVKSALEEADDPSQPVDLVLFGTVGGVEGFVWEPDRAVFTVLDSELEDLSHSHGTGHDADNCPFCRANRKKALESTAQIRMVSAQGQVVGVDARALLGLDEGQTVVVEGQGHIGSLGNLVVEAQGLYVRP